MKLAVMSTQKLHRTTCEKRIEKTTLISLCQETILLQQLKLV